KNIKIVVTVIAGIYSIILIPSAIEDGKQRDIEEAEYQEKVEQEEKEEAEAEEKAKAEAKEKEEKEQKEKEKEAKEEKERKANRDVDEAAEEDFDDVAKTELHDGELSIEFEPDTMWNENSMVQEAASKIEEVKSAFDYDEDLDSVVVMLNVEMMDEKGNED